MNPRKFSLWLIAALLLGLGACATPDSRIRSNQALFDAYPPAVREKIRAGEVEVGFTPAMVRLALGEPARRYTRTTAQGTDEVWAYRGKRPRVSLGLGFGAGGGSAAYGAGVSVGGGEDRAGDRIRVVFTGGKVVAVEQAAK